MIQNGIIITENKVIDTMSGCGGSLEIELLNDETGETFVWRKDLMEMAEEVLRETRPAAARRRRRRYTMVVVDASNGEHTTFCGSVEAGVSEELIRECFKKRFGHITGYDGMCYYFDWEDQWESGDLSIQLNFES